MTTLDKVLNVLGYAIVFYFLGWALYVMDMWQMMLIALGCAVVIVVGGDWVFKKLFKDIDDEL